MTRTTRTASTASTAKVVKPLVNCVSRKAFTAESRALCSHCARRIEINENFLVADPVSLGEGGTVICADCLQDAEWKTGFVTAGVH